jgi:hypothetical protein
MHYRRGEVSNGLDGIDEMVVKVNSPSPLPSPRGRGGAAPPALDLILVLELLLAGCSLDRLEPSA